MPPVEIAPSTRASTTPLLGSLPTPSSTTPAGSPLGRIGANHRHSILRRYHRTALNVIHRYGRPIYGAFTEDGLAGVAATFAAGLYPPPAWTTAYFVPGFLLAGPDRSSAAA